MLHENTGFKLAVHCSSTWQIQPWASCKGSCTTERCSQPLLCQAGSTDKQKWTREVTSSVRDFRQLRDPMFDLKTYSRGATNFQPPFQMGGLEQLLLGMKSIWAASLWRAAKKQSSLSLGCFCLESRCTAACKCSRRKKRGKIGVWGSLRGKEKFVLQAKAVIALLLKTRLHVSWSLTHNLWVWGGTKGYNHQFVFYRAVFS